MVKLRPETVAASSVVGKALELARAGTGVVHVKVARDVVTDTDVVIEDSVRRSLMSSFGWPVIGEERGGDVPDKGSYWLVDPICGTRNFASGIPLFSVNVALVESGEPTVAVVGDGSSGDILVAEAGNSCWSAGSGSLSRLWTSQRSLTVDFEAWPKAGAGRDRAAAQLAAAVGADRWDVAVWVRRWLSPTSPGGGWLDVCCSRLPVRSTLPRGSCWSAKPVEKSPTLAAGTGCWDRRS